MSAQVWLWVVLAILVVALAVVALLRSQSRRPAGAGAQEPAPAGSTDPTPPEGVEMVPADSAGATGAAPAASGPESKPSAPADSALAALDSGFVPIGLGASAAAAVDAVRAGTGPAEGPHAGSALPTADGLPPSTEFAIKANEGSRRYHDPGSPFYVRTRADLWFRSAAHAEEAGFASWDGSRAT